MNILFLINYAGGAGTEKYVDNLQRIYTSEGNSCFLAYNIAGRLVETMKERGIPCLQLGLTKADFKESPKLLADYCKDNKIDVIHVQYPVENIIAVKSLKYYSKPNVVLTRHLSDYQGFKWKVLNKIYTPKNHCIICVCDEAAENLVKCGVAREKIKVIFNGVEYDETPKDNTGGYVFKLVILARYAKEKGLDFLMESLAVLKKKTDKKFILNILGEGEEYDNIAKKIESLGLGEEVKQLGYRTDTKDFLDDANLYLNSSGSGEAMSFAILEAMNAGLPVVATDVGGNSTLVEKNIVCGKILKYGDTEAFSNAILEYMNNPELLKAHSLEAKRKVKEQFDLVKLAHDVYDAYK